MGTERISVLVADDHRLFREALRTLLERECDVVGEAASGEEAIAATARLRPDVVSWISRCPASVASIRRIGSLVRRRSRKSSS
jgi:DNA-binding NarL/FixJ family response regulator